MSARAITLDEKHFRAVEAQAQAAGKTPEEYLQALIDAAGRSFDEILRPVRQGFEHMTDAEIDDLCDRATKFARAQSK